MRIFTSRYANRDLANRPDLVKVGISVGAPRFKIGYNIETRMHELMPTWLMVQGIHQGKITREEYESAYLNKLDSFDSFDLMPLFERISRLNGDRDLVLLCFEDLRKPGAFCHRRMFASWWKKRTGEEVRELKEVSQAEKRLQSFAILGMLFAEERAK